MVDTCHCKRLSHINKIRRRKRRVEDIVFRVANDKKRKKKLLMKEAMLKNMDGIFTLMTFEDKNFTLILFPYADVPYLFFIPYNGECIPNY
jgi:hypothetical protein